MTEWMRDLISAGEIAEIFEIEQHDLQLDADEAEDFYIDYFRAAGCNLINRAAGGRVPRGFKHTAEHSAKMSAMRKGVPNLGNKGQKRTPEQRAKISAAIKEAWTRIPHPQKGRVKPPEEIAKIVAGRKGKPCVLTEAGRKAVSDAAKKRWQDPEARARFTEKMSGENNPRFGKRPPEHQLQAVRDNHRSKIGYRHSEETKQRISAGHAARRAAKKAENENLPSGDL